MILTNEANNILTAIVFGMKKEEPSDHVRLAATNALLNSLEFTRANFDKDVSTEKHFFAKKSGNFLRIIFLVKIFEKISREKI